MDKDTLFLFDLDGTITKQETLPLIAKEFHLQEEIAELTEDTIKGNIPYIESFIKRVAILGKLPISQINELLSNVELFEKILDFIAQNRENCIVVTTNFEGWIQELLNKIGCKYYASSAIVTDDNIKKLTNILKKEDIVKRYKELGKRVVMIGDGNNDMEAMREADISIACGLIHYPARTVLNVADYAVFHEDTLVRLLTQIKKPQDGLSVVLTCAGIGSRLGLDQTKALIELDGTNIISHQLAHLQEIDDVRIVIGYQADAVIEAVLKIRKDVLFVYNHDYFYTKTGTSYYLGAKDANEFVISWDGDLIIHPDDVQKCLVEEEYIGCSEVVSDEPVYVKLNEKQQVLGFSREIGDLEWVGPACLKREKIKYVSSNVFNIFEQYLPIKALEVDARDVDTYEDYLRAKEFVKGWK